MKLYSLAASTQGQILAADGNSIMNNAISGWGLFIIFIAVVVIFATQFIGKNANIMRGLGMLIVVAVVGALIFNIDRVKSFGESIVNMFLG